MSSDELRVLADEQAALRRVATLIARGVPVSAGSSCTAPTNRKPLRGNVLIRRWTLP